MQAAFGGCCGAERRGSRVSRDAARSLAGIRAAAAGGKSGATHRGFERRVSFSTIAETFAHWYKLPAPPADTLAEAVYGLPELYADALPEARIVANPGCYPTSVILGLRPLVDAGWIDSARGIVCDCKSGASGAGKEPKREMHFVEVNENFRAYGLFTHRHTPEVTEHLGLADEDFVFTTHLLPVERGILSTLYVWLDGAAKPEEIEALYRKFYAGRPMVRIWPAGQLPELQHVAHTNFCDIGFALDAAGRRLVIVSCLDNLGKGAAGQAVQNMNWNARLSGNGGTAMRLVVKIAGALLETRRTRAIASRGRSRSSRTQGHELLVIHGGGKIFTATLKRMGIESKFVNGLRVTDRETRDVAVMVFGGLLNKRLAGAISLPGSRPWASAPPMPAAFWPSRCRLTTVTGSLGFVGYLTGVNLEFLRIAVERGRGAGGVVPGPGRRRRTLQHQCRSHGRGVRRIHSRRPADLPHRRGRRARRRKSAEGRVAAQRSRT